MLRRAKLLLVGAGGLGGHIATSLSQKGIGHLVICDHDIVEISNLARQCFLARDLHSSKALCLARHAARAGSLGAKCTGHAVGFYEDSAEVLSRGVHIAVVAVDNNATRLLAAEFLGQRGIPVVFTAVNEDADYCWCFTQEAPSPCVACVYPRMLAALTEREPCRDHPACIDVLKVAAGMVGHAVDSVLMKRPRAWDLLDFDLTGQVPGLGCRVGPRPGCPLCGGEGNVW